MSPIKIRPMTDADIPTVTDLCRGSKLDVSSQSVRARFQILQALEGQAIFVATEGNQIVGWIHVCSSITLTHTPRGEVVTLIVLNETRNKLEVVRGLLKASETWASQNELSLLRVRAEVNKDFANEIYVECGFEIAKTAHVYLKELMAPSTERNSLFDPDPESASEGFLED